MKNKKNMLSVVITMIMAVIVSMFAVPHALADSGEVLGTRNPVSGYSGPYKLSEGNDQYVWCLDFGKAEPMANGGTEYSEPEKIENVNQKDLNTIIYALQEGKKAIEENNAALAGAAASVIHASDLNSGIPFDSATMVPDESRADFDRIMSEAPEAPQGAYLTARTPKDWKAGGKDGYQRVLDYDQIKTGILEVEKKDALSGENLAGAEFMVLDKDGNTVVGKRETKDVPYRIQVNAGEYTVVEGKAPQGYALNGDGSSQDNSLAVTVGNTETKRVTFANKPYPELTITKTDDQGAPLEGAKIKVTGDNGDEASFTSNGKPFVLKVRPGNYTVQEVEAPAGYEKEEQALQVSAQLGDSPQVNIVNKKETEPQAKEVITAESTPAPVAPTPEIGTQAHVKDSNVIASGGTIVDAVSYTNLEPGTEYTLSATTVCKENGQATQNKAEMSFTPENTSGVQDIEIPIVEDGCAIQTVFEELHKDGELVAEHKDVNDDAQTVGMAPQPKKPRIIIQHIPSGPTSGVHPDVFPEQHR